MNKEISSELPEGWKEKKLIDLIDEIKNKGEVGRIPYIEIGDIDLATKSYKFKDKKSITGCIRAYKNDIIVSRVRPTRGAISLIKEESITVSNAFTILRTKSKLLPKYLFYFLMQESFFKYLGTLQKGTMYPSCKSESILNYTVVFSDIVEQSLIVQEIEKQFTRLDAAVKSLKSVKNKLEIYRKSVLKAAFEGKLVETKSEWSYEKLSDLCVINPSKKEVKNLDVNMEITFLPMPFVSEHGKIISREKKKLKEVIKGYTYFRKGDVLLAKITPCFENGKRAIAEDLYNGIGFGSTEFHVLRPKEKVTSDWIFFGIGKDDFRNEAKHKMTGTVGQKRVPKRIVENFEIPVPKIEEQIQIVSEIESRFSVIDKLEETVDNALVKAEQLRKSILKSAFEGKLVNFKNKEK